MRTVRELERAGASAIHIEDQIYPKRVHYHKGVEHVISRQEMLTKIKAALAARTDPDMVIIGRTDAMRTDDFAEGVARANLFLEAGVDMVMIFPNSVEEARRAPREIHGPICYVNSEGNRLDRPVFSVKELEDIGYKLVAYSATLICAVTQELKRVLTSLKSRGISGLPADEMIRWRKEVEDLIGLEEYYKIESKTVER
jgi:methylisocitrate lyase